MRKTLGAAGAFNDFAGRPSKIEAAILVCTGDFNPNLPSSRRIAGDISDTAL